VVLTGTLTADGFMATDMTAKCPSKYEEAPPNFSKAQ
jgi:cytochrome c-type biogenesis protein CcmE